MGVFPWMKAFHFLAASLIVLSPVVTLGASNETREVRWQNGLYGRYGVVASWASESTPAPSSIDAAQYFGSDMPAVQFAAIASFSVEYTLQDVWVQYFDKD